MRSCPALAIICCLMAMSLVERCQSGPIITDTTLDQLREMFDNFPIEYEYPQNVKSSPEKRERACLINAGLSQGCDLSDILMAKHQASKFSSFSGPGRRRKRLARFVERQLN